jgi:cytidyltransferase-like protein
MAVNISKQIIVTGGFDDIRSRHLRFLEEASKLGELTVLLWPDEALQKLTGKPPKFPLPERNYFLDAVRYVSRVTAVTTPSNFDELGVVENFHPDVWVDLESPSNNARQAFCDRRGLEYRILRGEELRGFSKATPLSPISARKKVVVTGCYDWFHSGHVRFCEEVCAHGDLYVIVGHDANIRLLKGEGHPLLPQDERRYVVGSIKYVTQSLISSGNGWLDADPEIKKIKPDIYAVNEDGDKGGKRKYCEKLGIEYLVLKRTPAPGLPKRSSSDLRGF